MLYIRFVKWVAAIIFAVVGCQYQMHVAETLQNREGPVTGGFSFLTSDWVGKLQPTSL